MKKFFNFRAAAVALLIVQFINFPLNSSAKLPWSKNKSKQTGTKASQTNTGDSDASPLEQIQNNTNAQPQDTTSEVTANESADPNESIGNFDKAVTVQQIQVVGNQMVPTTVILDNMRTKVGSKFSRRKIAFDLQSLNNLGYFDRDKLLAVPIPKGDEGVVLRIQVVENRPITGLIIKGNELVDKTQVEEFLTPLIGMPRSTTQIRTAVEKVEKVYHDKGYLLASVTELHFDPDGFLMVSIDEGKIDKVEFEGNERTKEDYLKRVMPKNIQEGQAYNEESVVKFMEGLQKSGFFKDVKREVKADPNDPTKHVLAFKLEEQRTKSLNVGTGLGTLNGFFGTVSFTEPNFRGQGENLSVTAQAGTGLLTAIDGSTGGRFARRGDYRFGVNYTDPFVGKSDVSMGLSTGAQQFGSYIVDSSVQRSLRAGVNVSKPIKRWGERWTMQAGLSASDNKMINFGTSAQDKLVDSLINKKGKSFADATAEAESLRRKQLKDGFYLDFTPSLVYRHFDDNGSGWRNTFFGGPSLGLGGAGSYLSSGVDLRRYQKLTEDGWYFKNAAHAENLLGDAAGFRNLKMGGPYGMRGYRQFSDIGIGTTMLSNTAELSIPFSIPKNPIKDTKLVLFNDLGLVAGQGRLNSLYDRRSIAASIGAGLELNIPFLGPLRLDYGIPLMRVDNKSFWSGRFHINVGSQL
jgi:outer membrane protein assembly factor BamA